MDTIYGWFIESAVRFNPRLIAKVLFRGLFNEIVFSRFQLTSCTILKNRQDACEAKSRFSRFTGILPVHKRFVDNGATSQFQPTFALRQGIYSLADFLTSVGCCYIAAVNQDICIKS